MTGPVIAQNRPDIRYVWRGPSVLVVDTRGRAGDDALSGFFFRETRYLSELRLLVDGEEPFPCSEAQVAPNALELSLIYPPVESQGGGGSGSGASGRRHGLLFRTLDLDLRYAVRPASVEVLLRVTNRWNEPAEFDLAWALAVDYAGTMEAQAEKRSQEGPVDAVAADAGVRFRYGHPELPLETHVRVAGPAGWAFRDGRLGARLSLARQEAAEIRLTVRAVDSEEALDESAECEREARLDAWQRSATRVFAPGETPLATITNDAMTDLGALALLDGAEDEWLVPGAGMPLYPGLFGRDALTAGWQAAVFDRGQLVEAALVRLGRLQGTEVDDRRDEQPGRIVQQARRDPVSRLGRTPFDRYYGDVASPLLFVIGLGSCTRGRATRPPWRGSGTRRAACSTGRASSATGTATGTSSTRRAPPTGRSTRGGRTATTPWFTPTGVRRSRPSPRARSRATTTPPCSSWPCSPW